MARNRQRAKERQARRKAQGGATDGQAAAPKQPRRPAPRAEPDTPDQVEREAPDVTPGAEPVAGPDAAGDGRQEEPLAGPDVGDDRRDQDEVEEDAYLRANAPPEDVGRSDEVLEFEQDLDSDDKDEHFDLAQDEPEEDLGPDRSSQRAAAERHKDRPRFVQFLFAVWAELKRVQWPDRQALTTLTGVVLGFVLLAGGYLGLLDAIFSRIIQAIL